MYNEKIEQLIKAALADGVLTEKEKQILFKRAQEQGIDLDEFEMVLDARLVEIQKAEKDKAEKSAPKSTKFGDVRKCPVCGALLPALAVSCAECGYEFSGIDESSPAQLLSKKISEVIERASVKKNEIISGKKYSSIVFHSSQEDAIENIDYDAEMQIDSIIKNLPVPNTKKDLFDLILFLKQRSDEEAYKEKFDECIERANYLYPSDPLFAEITADITKAEKIEKAKYVIMIVCLLVSLVVYFLWAYLHSWGWLSRIFGLIPFLGIGAVAGVLLNHIYREKIKSK